MITLLAELGGTADHLEMARRLGVATALGALIGLDRELRRKPAGLRTMMLTALGTATVVIVGDVGHFAERPVTGEGARIIQGVVAGIGFLGAGVVLHTGTRVANLTTAAAVWVTAAMGVAAGMGEYALALIAAGIAFVTLTAVSVVERMLPRGLAEDKAETGHAEETQTHAPPVSKPSNPQREEADRG